MPKTLIPFCFLMALFFSVTTIAQEPTPSPEMLAQVARLKAKQLPLIDYHIHLRGGMTAEKAYAWQQKSGIQSCVLENHGIGWPLSDNEKLAAFIKDARLFPVKVGIQVNDSDWLEKVSEKNLENLDFILADTMIMALEDGAKPQKLWLENEYKIDDTDAFFERYFRHCMTVVNEPIDILANPTYLPNPLAKSYDRYWTLERITQFIDAAVKNDVALEIQSGSTFPSEAFLKLALERGAKITIGRNNFDDKKDELKRSLDLLEKLNVKPDNMLDLFE